MLNLYLTRLRWELHDARWDDLLGNYAKADRRLISITKRYLQYVGKNSKNNEQEEAEEDAGKVA